ncbi:hypothetical protein HispidOSU_018063 [Sigmodon hispidus]
MDLLPPAGKVAPRLTRQPPARPAASHRRALPLVPPRGRPRRAGRPGRGRRARAPLRCVAASPLPSMNGALSAARLRTGLALAAPRSDVSRACAGRSREAGPGGWAGSAMACRGRSVPFRERARRAPPLAFKGRCHLSLKTLAGVGAGRVKTTPEGHRQCQTDLERGAGLQSLVRPVWGAKRTRCKAARPKRGRQQHAEQNSNHKRWLWEGRALAGHRLGDPGQLTQ